MLFLGIDQSLSRPGIVVLDAEGALLFGECLSVSAKLRGGERLCAITGFVQHCFFLVDPSNRADFKYCMEGPNLNAPNPQVLFDLGECAGAIKSYIYDFKAITPTIVAPTQLKKFATDKGLADKDAVLHAVKKNWGHDFGTQDDIADAYVLARIAYCMTTEKFDRRCEADIVYALLGVTPKAPRKPRAKNYRNENL